MCVIVHQPVGKHLDKNTASKLWQTNSDGGGFAFIDDYGELQVHKTMQFGKFWGQFENARSTWTGRDFLLHMRIATHGKVDISNVHPFQVDEHTVMAHNGIIHGVTPFLDKEDPRSDTLYFVEEVLPRLPETWLDDPFLTDMVQDWVGWSKLMFLTTNPKLEQRVYRLGDWQEHEGLPMSNLNGLSYSKVNTTKKETKTYPSEGFYSAYGEDRWNNRDYYPGLPEPESKVPDTKTRGTYSETSQDWADWLEYKGMVFGDEEIEEMDDTDLDILLEALNEERKTMFINHPIIILDNLTPVIECGQCMTQIDLETAECQCWDAVCQECWSFMALCRNEGACQSSSMLDYDSLTERGKEFVDNGGLIQLDRKTVISSVPRKEGNTSTN